MQRFVRLALPVSSRLRLSAFSGLLWVLVVSMLVVASPANAKRVALLIGNAQYAHERPLRNPVKDAELLGRVLREDLKFDEVRVLSNLGLAAMDREIEGFAQRARGASVALLYYSGHGMTSPERVTFLLPVDARTGVADALRLERQAVSALDVRRLLSDSGAQTTLMILDACRDGPGAGRSGGKGLARVGGGNGLLIAYATEEGRIAEDGAGENSPYAEALAAAWRQQHKTILEQLDFVYDEVTRRHPGQRPDREGNLRASTRLMPGGVPPAAVQLDPELAAWGACQGGSDPQACRAYLAAWPQGRYADRVRQQLSGNVERAAPPGWRGLVPVPVAVWQRLEASPMFRATPAPVRLQVRAELSSVMNHSDGTGSTSTDGVVKHISHPEVGVLQAKSETMRHMRFSGGVLAGRESRRTSAVVRYFALAGLLPLADLFDGSPVSVVTRIDSISGDLFPLKAGSSLSVRFVEGPPGNDVGNRQVNLQCSATEKLYAAALDQALSGDVWEVRCERVSESGGKIDTYAWTDYFWADGGVFVSAIGDHDHATRRAVIPRRGTRLIVDLDRLVITKTYSAYEILRSP